VPPPLPTSTSGLQAVFLEKRATLLRLLVARLGNREDAEDALQDLWLKLDGLATGPIADPAAFLYRMAANQATDRRIAGQRREARDDAWQGLQSADADRPDAERTLIARDRLARVEGAIADMPDRMRAALRMFRLEDRPQRAIADELGISLSGVEKLLQRAYRQICAADVDGGAEASPPRRLREEGGPHGRG
jgi:RNA polymerase sigma factor (sigma-70 family)